MKGCIFLLTIILAGFLTGCAIAEQDGSEIGQQFQDGLSGRGTIVPNNPTGDSFGSDYR